MFRIIYLWRGERHVHSRQPDSESDAARLAEIMRKEGWRAWVERVGGGGL